MAKKQSASKNTGKASGVATPEQKGKSKALASMDVIPGCEHLWSMKFLPERGFNFAKAHHSFLSTVNNLHWERFVQIRAYYLEQLVREFYSGIQNTRGGTIFFPNWVIDEEEEVEEEEEVVAVEKKKEAKRKRGNQKDKKGKKPRVEEIESDEEETEEDEEARRAVKEIEKDMDEDDSESMEESEEENGSSTMEASARRKYEIRSKTANQQQPQSPPSEHSISPSPPPQKSPTTHLSPNQPSPKDLSSPSPQPEKQPTPQPEITPPQEKQTQFTREDTPFPSQTQKETSPTLITEPIPEPTNIVSERVKMQVLPEEPEKEKGKESSEKVVQAENVKVAASVPTPGAEASKKSTVMETSPAETITAVLKALAEKKEMLGYTRRTMKPAPTKKMWTMSSLYGEQGTGVQTGEKEATEEATTKEGGKEAEKVAEQPEEIEQTTEQTSVQSGVPASEVQTLATPDVPAEATPKEAEMPEATVDDPGVPTSDVATAKKQKKPKAKHSPAVRASPRFQKKEQMVTL